MLSFVDLLQLRIGTLQICKNAIYKLFGLYVKTIIRASFVETLSESLMNCNSNLSLQLENVLAFNPGKLLHLEFKH